MRFDSLAGRIARFPLRLIPRATNVQVRSGLNKGLRWRVGSATHGCWLGHYESEVQRQLPALIRDGMVCYDIGANAGFYTLALARLAGPTGRVFAFEPLAANAAHLLHHLRLNNLSQASLIQVAVSDSDGLTGFEVHESASMGRLNSGSTTNYLVPSVRLDTVMARDQLPAPNFIKMDVEGAELAALTGAEATLADHRPTLLIAFHGEHLFVGCLQILAGLGYAICDLDGHPLSSKDHPVNEVIATHPGSLS